LHFPNFSSKAFSQERQAIVKSFLQCRKSQLTLQAVLEKTIE
jgi:hypothetical protein